LGLGNLDSFFQAFIAIVNHEARTRRQAFCDRVSSRHADLRSGSGGDRSLLAQLLDRQGPHRLVAGDRDPIRARRFLGKKKHHPHCRKVTPAICGGIVKAARRCQLIINASASVFNEIVIRARPSPRAHYMDLIPTLRVIRFQSEQFRYAKRFEEKNRAAVINAALPPSHQISLSNAPPRCSRSPLRQIRPYEKHESQPNLAVVSRSLFRRQPFLIPASIAKEKFKLAKRFPEIEKFRFM